MAGIHVVDHPLVQHKISLMRDKMTGVKEFRELTSETAMLICYEATRDLPMKEVTIETHQGIAKTKKAGFRSHPACRSGTGRRRYFAHSGGKDRSYRYFLRTGYTRCREVLFQDAG